MWGEILGLVLLQRSFFALRPISQEMPTAGILGCRTRKAKKGKGRQGGKMYKTLSAPLVVQVEMSARCNQRCLHCYNYWRRDDEAGASADLLPEKAERVINQLIAARVFHVTFTGGEPLLNKQGLFRALECAHSGDLSVGVNSNLAPLLPADASRFHVLGVSSVLTSLMGPSAETHDEIAQCPGSFARTVRGIKLLRDAGISVVANMVITPKNMHLLPETVRLGKSLGLSSFSSTRAGCPGNCSDFSEFSLTLPEFRAYLESLYVAGTKSGIKVGVLESYPLCAIKEMRRYREFTGRYCSAGVTTITVAADGNVRPCSHLDVSYGNLLQDELRDIWPRMSAWRDGSLLPRSCQNCKALAFCGGGCRMESKMRSGSLNAPDPYMSQDDAEYVIGEMVRIGQELKSREDAPLPCAFSLNPKLRWRQEEFGAVAFVGPHFGAYLNGDGRELLVQFGDLGVHPIEELIGLFKDQTKTAPFISGLFRKHIMVSAKF